MTRREVDRDGKTLERHEYYTSGKGKTSEVGPAATPSEKLTLEYIHQETLTRVTDGLGNVTEYRFGSVAGLPQVWGIQGPCAGCPGGGHQTQEWQYDDQGRITKYTDGLGHATGYAYATHGLETETRWPIPISLTNTHVTSYTYYPDGRLHTRTEPNGAVTTITYLPAGPETITETITSTTNRVTEFSYTTNGKLQFITDPRGKDWEFHFFANGDLEWTEDPLGFQTSYQHDLLGRVTRTIPPTTTPMIQSSIYLYDTLGRVRRITNPVDSTYTEFTYDGGGRRTKLKDPRDTVTDYEYDLNGRLWKVKNVRPGLSTLVTEYGYDVMSNLTSIKDPRLKTTSFEYDGYNRVEKIIYPGATAPFEFYTYNDAGMLATRQDRSGVTTTFWYDGLGRLTRKDYSDSTPDLVFGYDARGGDQKGRLTSAANGTVSLEWTYDLAGQLLDEAATRTGGSPSTVAYTYYVDGSRETLTVNGTQFLRYTYDDRALPDMIRRLPLGTGDFVFTHDAASRRSALTLPTTAPATRTDYTYDARTRLASVITSRNSVPIGEFTYPLYDPSDNRLSRGGSTAPAETYHYDDVYRLDWVKRGVPFSETYSHDEVGNRLTSIPFPTPNWSYGDRNELLAYGGDITLGYDNNGNLTSKTETSPSDAWTYEWDVENRLKRVTHNGVQVATYNYDPLGRRNERNLGTITYTYVYDREDIVLQDDFSVVTEPIPPPPHLFIHGPGIDEPLAVKHGDGTVWYMHADGLGSIIRTTDGSGTVISSQSRQYDTFGNLESGAGEQGFAYTGREWDPETGLYYYRARYYDPKIGRFISEDSAPPTRGGNLYAYVDNNPVNFTDPTGHVPKWAKDAAGWAAGAAAAYSGYKWLKCMWEKEQCNRAVACHCAQQDPGGAPENWTGGPGSGKYLTCVSGAQVRCCEARYQRCMGRGGYFGKKWLEQVEECPPGI